MMTPRRHLVALLFIGIASPIYADNPYVVGFGVAADSSDAYSVSALVDYAFSDNTSVNLDADLTQAEGDPEDYLTHSWSAGLRHEFKHIGVDTSIGQWGDEDEFTSDNWSLGLFRSVNLWQIEAAFIKREFELTLRSTLFPDQITRADVSADGYKLGVSYSADSGAGLHVTAKTFDYSRDLTRLGQFRVTRLLSPSALTLSGSLVDHSVSVGGDWPFGEQLLSLNLARDRTAVDRIDVDTVSVSWLTPIARRSDLDIGIGVSRDNEDTQYFVSLLFLFYGGFE